MFMVPMKLVFVVLMGLYLHIAVPTAPHHDSADATSTATCTHVMGMAHKSSQVAGRRGMGKTEPGGAYYRREREKETGGRGGGHL